MAEHPATNIAGDIANAQAYCKAALLLASELEEPLAVDPDGYSRLQALSATLLQIDAHLKNVEDLRELRHA